MMFVNIGFTFYRILISFINVNNTTECTFILVWDEYDIV